MCLENDNCGLFKLMSFLLKHFLDTAYANSKSDDICPISRFDYVITSDSFNYCG